MIRISSEVQRTALVLDAIIRTDRKAPHAFRLVVIHAHGIVELRRQAGVEGMMAVLHSRQTRIMAGEKEIEVFQSVKTGGLTGELLWWWLLMFVRHIG